MSDRLNLDELRAWLDRPWPPRSWPPLPRHARHSSVGSGSGSDSRGGHPNADRCDFCEGFGRVFSLQVDEQLEAGHA